VYTGAGGGIRAAVARFGSCANGLIMTAISQVLSPGKSLKMVVRRR